MVNPILRRKPETKNKSVLIPFSFLILVFFLNIAYANGDVNLSQFPNQISDVLGIPLFAGQILASTIVLALFLLPTLVATRNEYAILVMGLLPLCVCLALGWLPYWILLLIALVIAFRYAGYVSGKIADVRGG